MICLAGLLLAVPLKRKLDSCDSPPLSQEKLLPIFPQDEFVPPRINQTAAEKQTKDKKRAAICGSSKKNRRNQAERLIT
ncbi:hypothetical protein [Pseudomonas sp. BP8]|uniref:hypothetical protein n=1 Tax=Pseudomonas sp. BP8 TaxID=2817864 RepID=UPI001AE50704|nr:hypothetical protein [Pseudomonas sp. BP8]MBP2260361.1 hypothetical protein [Pseudomonas sp. BP8]HDS1735992.1 hypothetical protein [Pseudomonas putida]